MEKENLTADNTIGQVYEVSFNILPTLSEEALALEFGNLKETISKLGGLAIDEQYPRPIGLAYTMVKVINNKNEKFNSAYFGWIKYELDPAKAPELKKLLENDLNIIRFMTIKTARESTLAPKKMFRPEARRKFTGKDEAKEGEEMDKEAVDKKIEELSVAA